MSADAGPSGGLVVDKAQGPTSHDVVARARAILATRRVGHAGTLDPMASGVLVLLVGEATKLSSYLTLHDKRYRARVAFGASTTTLDADGAVEERAPVPPALLDELRDARAAAARPDSLLTAALALERARTRQLPPAHSAIKVAGRPSYERARRGEEVSLEPRPVVVFQLEVVGGAIEPEPLLELELLVSKGYYVRSLARDLGLGLGVPAHLAALRRLASGPFSLESAVPLEGADRARLVSALLPPAALAGLAMPIARLTDAGASLARLGKKLAATDFESPPPVGRSAWVDARGALVAVGIDGPAFTVERGFR